MANPGHTRFSGSRPVPFSGLCLLALLACAALAGCRSRAPIAIAVIPRTSGTMLWEPEHGGAQATAFTMGARIYWNAPTREDDVEGQIALVQRVSAGNYQGLVLAPDQSRALITPVRRAMQRGLSIVVVGSPLPIPPGDRLSYILNDDQAGGRIAASRIAALLRCRGTVAILGIDYDIAGIVTRARSLEEYLANSCPALRLVKKAGAFNVPRQQQVAEETLKENPDLDAVVALTHASALGVLAALKNIHTARQVRIVSFDPDAFLFDNPQVDSMVLQDTQKMGAEAVRLIVSRLRGQGGPAVTLVEPVLVTRANVDSPEVRQLTSMDWRPEPLLRAWRVAR